MDNLEQVMIALLKYILNWLKEQMEDDFNDHESEFIVETIIYNDKYKVYATGKVSWVAIPVYKQLDRKSKKEVHTFLGFHIDVIPEVSSIKSKLCNNKWIYKCINADERSGLPPRAFFRNR